MEKTEPHYVAKDWNIVQLRVDERSHLHIGWSFGAQAVVPRSLQVVHENAGNPGAPGRGPKQIHMLSCILEPHLIALHKPSGSLPSAVVISVSQHEHPGDNRPGVDKACFRLNFRDRIAKERSLKKFPNNVQLDYKESARGNASLWYLTLCPFTSLACGRRFDSQLSVPRTIGSGASS